VYVAKAQPNSFSPVYSNKPHNRMLSKEADNPLILKPSVKMLKCWP